MERLKDYKHRRIVDSSFLKMSLLIKEFGLEELTFISVLKGGAYTANNILRYLPYPEDTYIGYVGISSYGDGIKSTKDFTTTYHFDLNEELLKGRNVWIVDDICDTGHTLDIVKGMVALYEPKSIHTAVLVDKKHVREKNNFPEPDVIGFSLEEDKFLVGCGMGLGEKYRMLRELKELVFEED